LLQVVLETLQQFATLQPCHIEHLRHSFSWVGRSDFNPDGGIGLERSHVVHFDQVLHSIVTHYFLVVVEPGVAGPLIVPPDLNLHFFHNGVDVLQDEV
jgi:hypothetical protein